jgi:glutathione S-transferase
MSLKLYFHPFSSFCQKVLIALYENDIPFEPHIVDLMDERSRAEFKALWPIGKFPVLRDESRGRTIPESSIIIEYLEQHYPGGTPFIPADPEAALEARLWDRFYDQYLDMPVGKIVTDRLRPADLRDRLGVEEARAQLETAYGILEQEMADRRIWAVGDVFTMADCAAAPALFYADLLSPIGDARPNLRGYFGRLLDRPSFQRVVEEARPYLQFFPKEPA